MREEQHSTIKNIDKPRNASIRGKDAVMGREWSYEDIVRKGREKKYLAYARSEEEKAEIIEWLDGLEKSPEPIGPEITEAGREVHELFKKELYGVLPFEQYNLLNMRVRGMSRRDMMSETGKSQGALRKLIYDTKQSLKRKGLWDKYSCLFDF